MARDIEGPVVGSKKIFMGDVMEGEDRWWTRKVRFNVHTGIFSVRMPDKFTELFPDYEVPSGKTMDEAIDKFAAACKTWLTDKTTVTKVLLFRFPMEYTRFKTKKKEQVVDYRRADLQIHQEEDHPTFGLAFEWCVAFKREVGDQKPRWFKVGADGAPDFKEEERHLEPEKDGIETDYSDQYEHHNRGAREVPWTVEREQFMRGIETSIKLLIERVLVFEESVEDAEGMDRMRLAVENGTGQLLLGGK